MNSALQLISPLKALILGIVQGLGEFLPISSSGHILLSEQLLGIKTADPADEAFLALFTVFLHLSTLVAVLIVFWKDWWDIIRRFWKSKTLLMLIIASLPALLLKLILKKITVGGAGGVALDDILDSGFFMGAFFLVTSVLLALTEWLDSKHDPAKTAKRIPSYKDAVGMGCMQAVGMFCGISRSGSTIFGGVAGGLGKKAAAKFSFMMSVPAILGGLLLDGKAFLDATAEVGESASGILKDNILPILLGMLAAGLIGWLSIRFFLKLIGRASLRWFAVYMFLIGITVIILQITGVVTFPLPVANAV